MLSPNHKRRLAAMERSHQITSSDSEDTVGRIIDLLWIMHSHSVPTEEDQTRFANPTEGDPR